MLCVAGRVCIRQVISFGAGHITDKRKTNGGLAIWMKNVNTSAAMIYDNGDYADIGHSTIAAVVTVKTGFRLKKRVLL